MSTIEDRQAKMLERVRALLAKADRTNFPEEADAFRAKADELMTQHAIEMWQVEAAQAGLNQRQMPVRKDMDMQWYWDAPFRQHMWRIFGALAHHCRCTVVHNKWDYAQRLCPVIGLPADIAYFDMLFTHIMADLANKVNPKPSPDLDFESNLAMLKEAGLSWPEITRLMANAGLYQYKVTTTTNWRGEEVTDPRPWENIKNYGAPVAHVYRRWCKHTNTPQSYTNHKTYRRNFADGYVSTLRLRLSQMRHEQEDSYDANHQAGGMALVVRDIQHAVNELMWDIWPDMRPHPPECECDDCHTRKCEDPKCTRPRCKEKRKPIRYAKGPMRVIDHAARQAGSQAAKEANLAAHQDKRIGNRKELGR